MSVVYGSWSLRGLVMDLRMGKLTPIDAFEQSRTRIAATEREVQAWVGLAPNPDFSAGRGSLGGVPLGVKDIIDVAGLPTRCGSRLRANSAPAKSDAAVVAAWRLAGAMPVGKTVTTEFAYFSPGPTQNPASLGHTPGGSSSGSAAAVAAGHVPLALGSQTAGSVTRPAAYCGVAALVTSHGSFSLDGVTGLSPSLDSHGMFAASVSDLAMAWSAFAGVADPAATQRRPPRVLIWSATPLDIVSPEMAAALEVARERMSRAGAVVDDFPEEQLVSDATAAHPIVMAYEAARERAGELVNASELSEPLAALLQSGAATLTHDYEASVRTVADAAARVAVMLTEYDVIVGPAAPGPAPFGLERTGDPALSRAWQAMGLPALTVPGLKTASGLPLGLQAVARAGAEEHLLAIGCWLEVCLAG